MASAGGSGGGVAGPGEEGEAAVVAGVVAGVRQAFLDTGAGLEVLERLEQLWLSKLDRNREHHEPAAPVARKQHKV